MTMEQTAQRPTLYEQMLYNMKDRAGTPDAFGQNTYRDMKVFAGGAEKSGLTDRNRNYPGWKDSDFSDFLDEARKLDLFEEQE